MESNIHMQSMPGVFQTDLTKASACQIPEMDVPVPAKGMQGPRDTVAVEANAHAHYEQDRPRSPTQEGHDQKRVS